MRRMNVMIDEQALEKVKRKLGSNSYSGAINDGLNEFLRMSDIAGFMEYFKSGVWQGSLSKMRRDSISTKKVKK